MTQGPVRVGLLGAGFIGQMHSLAMRLASYARHEPSVSPSFDVLIERDRELGEQIATRYGWQSLVDDTAVLSGGDLDLFVNAGPNDAHFDASVQAATNGTHLFCEKPLAATADEAFALWDAVRATGVQHHCAFVHRFIPALRVARQMIEAGEIGEVRHVRSQFLLDMVDPEAGLTWRFDRARAGTGSLGDLGSHHIDVARFLVAEVVEVSAITRTWSEAPGIADVNDDAFVCAALLENGATASFEASRITPGHSLTGRIEVDGTKGSLAFDMERLNELVIRCAGQGPRVQRVPRAGDPYDGFWLPGGIQGSHPVGWQECFAYQAHDVLALAAGTLDDSPAATFEDGYRVAEIVDTIEDAARSGSNRLVAFRS